MAARPPKSEPGTEPWVSVREVAAHLGVRKDSIYRWIERRALPAQKIGKLWKLKLSEVDVWVRSGGADELDPPTPPPQVARGTPAALPAMRHELLVIDDDELLRDSVAEFLIDRGFAVRTAADGAEALALLAAAEPPPDLILLDLHMPNVDGWRFRALQAETPALAAIPVIVVTATRDVAVAGATVLRKPLRLHVLVRAIDDLLSRRSPA